MEFLPDDLYPQLWFSSVPEPIRFMTAGSIGTLFFFTIDQILYHFILPPLFNTKLTASAYKDSISFCVAYIIATGFRHYLNAVLVYGLSTISTREKYIKTLFLTYSSYLFSMMGSTIVNAVLLQRGMSEVVSFWVTILGFGVVDFFLLHYLVGEHGNNNYEGRLHDDMVNEQSNCFINIPLGKQWPFENENDILIARSRENFFLVAEDVPLLSLLSKREESESTVVNCMC